MPGMQAMSAEERENRREVQVMNQTSLSPETRSSNALPRTPVCGSYFTASGVNSCWPPIVYSRTIFCPCTEVTQAMYCMAAM
jgi:hypothetical protein